MLAEEKEKEAPGIDFDFTSKNSRVQRKTGDMSVPILK